MPRSRIPIHRSRILFPTGSTETPSPSDDSKESLLSSRRSSAPGTASPANPMDTIHLIGKLADLKDGHYRNTLALSAVIELLIEKGILSAQEIAERAAKLDAEAL